MQFVRRLVVPLPLRLRKIVAISKADNQVNFHGVAIAEELTAFDIYQTDEVEFSPADASYVARSGLAASGLGSLFQSVGGIGSSIVLAVGRHAALSRGLRRFYMVQPQ
jgi:hypothetical protein